MSGTSNKARKPRPESKNLTAWTDFLYLFISPDKAWLRIFKSGTHSDDTARRVFYPLIALSAALEFLALVYNQGEQLSAVIQQAVITFITWFIGYFGIVLIAAHTLLGEESKELASSSNGKKMIMLSLASLTIFYIAAELLPMLEPILVFAPLYTVFLITRGVKVIGVPADMRTRIAVSYSILTIGIPMLIRWLFETIMPTA